MTERNPPPEPEVRAEIKQVGRFTYHVSIKDGWFVWDYGAALGRKRAERKASRALARHRRKWRWDGEAWVVTE